MHNLALALHARGWLVTGSDDELFEPSRSRLAAAGLLPDALGWHPERLTPDLDAVILGMHAFADNPELRRAQQLGLRIYSFPEFLYEQMREKRRVVVCGSHGKTTTTAMIMHALRLAECRFDYMVGAQVPGFDLMVGFDEKAGVAVLEGDEYLTSPLDRRSKFLHYHPNVAIITGAEWDHVNVFPTYDDYLGAFRSLVASVEPDGRIFYCASDPHLRDLPTWPRARGVVATPYEALPWHLDGGGNVVATMAGADHPLRVFGEHNMLNMSAALLACEAVGLDRELFAHYMGSFEGAAKRLQTLASGPGLAAYLDFAHSPSKLRATVHAVRQRHPQARLDALFELHTFSSLTADFLPQYAGALDEADRAFVYFNPEAFRAKRLEPFSERQVRQAFGRDDLTVLTDLGSFTLPPCDVALLSSSGDFGGTDPMKLLPQT